MGATSRVQYCGAVSPHRGLPRCLSDKEFSCQCRWCRRCELDPWVWKIPLKEMPTALVFLPWESLGQRSLAGCSPQRSQRVRPDLVTKHAAMHLCVPTESLWFSPAWGSGNKLAYTTELSQSGHGGLHLTVLVRSIWSGIHRSPVCVGKKANSGNGRATF